MEYIEMLKSTDMGIRKEAINKIVENKKNELRGDLLGLVENGPTYLKLDALTAYRQIIGKSEVDSLGKYLNSKDWHIRLEAIRGISQLLEHDSLDIIMPFLKDRAYGVKSEVEKIVEKYKNEIENN
jgi:hypothetical protein